MRSRLVQIAASSLLALTHLDCGGRATPPPESAEDTSSEELVEDVEEEAPIDETEPEPPFAEHARQTLRASEPRPNTLGLHFIVTQKSADLPWLAVIANTSGTPTRVAADLRLLRLEIHPPASDEEARRNQMPKSKTCQLPEADRPKQPAPRLLVELEPDYLLVQQFDPRMSCDPDWLVPGAVVTPYFGWPTQTRTVWRKGQRVEEPIRQTAPFVATSSVQEGSALEPVKELIGEPITLDESYRPPPSAPPATQDSETPPPLELFVKSLGTTRDPRNAIVNIEIKNPARQSQYLFFRRELVTYEVLGPQGSTSCHSYPDDRAPSRQGFELIGAGGTMRIASRLAEMCPPGTFDEPGLYRVHARLEANQSGREFGLDAFTGVVLSRSPGLLRVQGIRPMPMVLLPIQLLASP